MPRAGEIRFGTAAGNWLVGLTALGSGIAFLEATVVNVALPAIGSDLDTDVAGLQWTLNGYLLTLAALILIGGSLGDRYGRRKVFVVGVVWFTGASALCALAPSVEVLVAARVFQGIGGALLTPGSLALIVWAAPRHIPESRDELVVGKLDLLGSALAALALGALTYALISASEGAGTGAIGLAIAIGVVAGWAFIRTERRAQAPMLPLSVFSSRQFTAANVVTFVVYAALGGVFFLLVIMLQIVLGYSAVAAGAAALPVTALMLALSARAGALAQRIGPRMPLTVGPLLIAAGMVLMSAIGAGDSYLAGVLPGVIVYGLGLALVVAPITATVLAAADSRHAGVASGVNNAVARTAQLAAVAALPLIVGLSGDDFLDPVALEDGFRVAMLVTAGLSAAGGLLAWLYISNDVLDRDPGPGHEIDHLDEDLHCSVAGTPLRPAREERCGPITGEEPAAPERTPA